MTAGADHARAARFLECLRTFDENNGDSPEFAEILAWASDHEQSLDWIFDGDRVDGYAQHDGTP